MPRTVYVGPMSVRPPDDVDILDLDDLDAYDRRPPGATRRPRQPRRAPQPVGPSWTDPRFLVPLLLFLTAVFLIGMAIRSGSGSSSENGDLLAQENAVLDQTELAKKVQEAELRAGFGGLAVAEEDGTIIITGTVPDQMVAASVGAVARSVEGTQRVDNRVVVLGESAEATPTSTAPVVAAGAGGLADQMAQAGQITFEPGSTAITAEGSATIDAVGALMNRAPGVLIEIHGHTDSDGDETANQVLSQQRAEAVLSALQQRSVDTSRLTAVGFGESNPIAPNITAEGRATNRRIEFVVS